MKKYIVSLVLAMKVPGQPVLNQKNEVVNGGYDISLQNEVSIIQASDAHEAYERCARLAKLKHAGHNIMVRVVIEMGEAMAEEIN